MKKIYTYFLSGAALLAVAACNKEAQIEEIPQNNGLVYETLSVKVGAETKVTLETDATKSAFESGDKIAVWTEAGEFQTCTVDGDGKISVDISGGARSNYAVYYNGATAPSFESSTLKITLPAAYDYGDVAGTKNPVPMVAKNVSGESGDMTFYAVCALARIAVPGIPATADKLLVTFNKDVTGEFTVANPGTATPSISAAAASTKNVVTINLVAGTDYSGAVINIPVPAGTVTASVQAKAGDTVLETKASVINSWSAARAQGRKATAAFTPSMYSMVLAPGNLYTEGGTLKMANKYYEHVYAFSSNDDYTNDEEKYDANNRTHFNFNETYHLMKGNTLSYDKAYPENNVGAYNLTKDNIPGGNSKTWRVPEEDDWITMTIGRSEFSPGIYHGNNRPGAKVRNGESGEYTTGWKYIKVLVINMSGKGTTVSSDKGVTISALAVDATAPSTNYQAGMLIFPDNVEITGSFTSLGEKNTKNSAYNTTTLSKLSLDVLIEAGCAFLPALGRWYYNSFGGVGLNAGYFSCTEIAAAGTGALNGHRFAFTNAVLEPHSSDNESAVFRSVRLVRDLN